MSKNDEITAVIRDVRKAKGLSQSRLSARIGVPQSHISKIENGTVDIKLSSLVQIARALDLEVKLVPRQSLPAVESVVRSTRGFPRDRTGPALSEIKKLERTLDGLKIKLSSANVSLPLDTIEKYLQSLKVLKYDTDAFVRLRKTLEPISKLGETLSAINIVDKVGANPSPLAKEINKLNRATDALSGLRNSLTRSFDVTDKALRPAYTFKEDDDE
jgi:transcriptional regulator with XRE-family HTH domain